MTIDKYMSYKKDGLGDRRPAKEHFNLWRKTIELDRLVDFRQDNDHVTSNCKKRGWVGFQAKIFMLLRLGRVKKIIAKINR